MSGVEVKALVEFARAVPPSSAAIENPGLIVEGVAAFARSADRKIVDATGAASDILATPVDAYRLGLCLLSLRAGAVARSGRSYASDYAGSCARLGLNAMEAKLRRRLMYVPVLAGDDGFLEVVAEACGRRGADGRFWVRKVCERAVGNWQGMKIDWLPFGGPP